MALPRRLVALFVGCLYGLAGAVLVGVTTYLSIVVAVQGSPLTGDGRLLLQCGLFVLPFGLTVALGWLTQRHTDMLLASALCGAVAGILYDLTYSMMIGAEQIHSVSNGGTPPISWSFDAGLHFAREHLASDHLYYLVLTTTAGAILGTLGGWIGKRRLQ